MVVSGDRKGELPLKWDSAEESNATEHNAHPPPTTEIEKNLSRCSLTRRYLLKLNHTSRASDVSEQG